MNCPYCKTKDIENDAKYCTYCGKSLENKTIIGWTIPSVISFIIFIFFVFILYSDTNIMTSPIINNHSIKKESSIIENYNDIKNDFTIDDKIKLLNEAKKEFDEKNYNSAIPKYEKLVEANYKPAESNFYLGEMWYIRKKYDLAINHFKKSAVLYDKADYMPILLLHSAVSFENIKDKNNAISFYTALIDLYPNSSEANMAKKNYLITNSIQKSSTKKEEDINRNSFQTIFEYKDWKIESFGKWYKMTTNGKIGANGHEFGIIKLKEECKNNYIWMSFSTIHDINSYAGEEVMFKITIDDIIFYQKIQIYSIENITKALNIAIFSNLVFNDDMLLLLKKGKKIRIEISESDKLYNKFDIKFEEFSLDGFVANYNKLDQKCNSSQRKVLFQYLINNDYGVNGLDRTYKLTKNDKSCIYNYIVGYYSGSIEDSCTGEYKFQIRDNFGNFLENSDNHWSPIPYHDAYRLITGKEMRIGQKMISTINSKNEQIYCLENMSICKSANELLINR